MGIDRVKETYTSEARRIAARSMDNLAQTRLTPTALTVSGVLLCAVSSIPVYFEYRNHLLFYWLGAAMFVIGSILDILDGALARAGGKTTPFGAFLDSTTDRIGEGFMLAAIGLVFARHHDTLPLAFAFAAVAGRVRPGPDARRPRRLPRPRHRVHRRLRRHHGQGREGPGRRDLGAPERHVSICRRAEDRH